MVEILRTSNIFDDWPENVVSGRCDILFHQISDAPEIIHVWTKGIFEVNRGSLIVQLQNMPEVPDGIYRVLGLLFYRPQENRHFRTALNPYDISIPDFAKLKNDWIIAFEEDAMEAAKKWEIAVTIGDSQNMEDILHCEAHFVCADCLITSPVRVGPAELYPLEPSGVLDLASSLKETLLFQGVRDVALDEIAKALIHQSDRRSPLFTMSFYRILRNDKEVIQPLMPFIKQIFGILCLNRGSYARILGCIYLKRRKGVTRPTYANLNSYYRGNLLGGRISKEIPELWNKQYTLTANDVYKTEIISKLNSAHAETDLDIAYFRLWSILESVSYVVLGNKQLDHIEQLCRQAYSPQNVEDVVKLFLGSQEFTFNDLLKMWLNWRDLTAHHGGIYAYYAGHKKIHPCNKKMIEEMELLNMPVVYGEDRSLFVLKDLCIQVVAAFINDKLCKE